MVDRIFFIAEILIVFSFLFRDILLLRVLSCLGMAAYIAGAAYAGLDQPGMKTLMFFSAIAVVVNLVHISILVLERWPIALPDDLKDIYTHLFTSMSAAEFKKVYDMAEITAHIPGDTITEQGKPVDDLIAIKSGHVAIIKDGNEITQIGSFYFIGEMSYLTGELATATVAAKDNMTCISWSKVTLNKLESTRPDLYNKLKQDISLNLIKKINRRDIRE